MKKSSKPKSSVRAVSSSSSGSSFLMVVLAFLIGAGGVYILSQDPAAVIPTPQVIEADAPVEAPALVKREGFTVQDSEVPGYKKFNDELYSFTIDYPEKWVLETPNFDLVAAMFFVPSGDGEMEEEGASQFFTNVNVTVDDVSKYPDVSLEQYAADATAQLESVFPEYELVGQGPRLLGDLDGYFLRASYFDGINNLDIFSLFTMTDKHVYAITYSDMSEEKGLIEPFVDRMIESFRLL
jgi:hypothetical protein